MNNSAYILAFELKISHDYFEDGIGSGIEIHPSALTNQLMRLYNMLFKKIDGTVRLYINTQETRQKFFNYIEAAEGINYFDFDVVIADPNFYIYTDIPLDSNTSYDYESNSLENIAAENKVLLHAKPSNEEQVGKFAHIRIYFDDILNASNDIPEFEIDFKRRATIWQYIIINKSNIKFSNPSIQGNHEIPFEGPFHVTLENGQAAMMFNSGDNLLAFSEIPKYKFDLIDTPKVNNHQGQTRVQSKKIISGLPNPKGENYKVQDENGTRIIISPMYIYV